jgi:hypothetical protein
VALFVLAINRTHHHHGDKRGILADQSRGYFALYGEAVVLSARQIFRSVFELVAPSSCVFVCPLASSASVAVVSASHHTPTAGLILAVTARTRHWTAIHIRGLLGW